MNFLALLERKRDGQALLPPEIRRLLADYTSGQVPDYQMAALLMAVFFRGLSTEETRAWTLAMRDSGTLLEFPRDSRPLADKHSTGGVGDKVSLALAPLLACLGMRVPMVSGRGLGITGGTLDKLESIPGFRTSLAMAEIVRQVQEVGCVICGQTESMVPADRALYALRDVTGTVPSIPLIVASILSKKLAESLQALVLDVKFGAAAFMPTLALARDLAKAMTTLGTECGVRTRALLTRMDAPLGRSVGNWLEVREAVACLEGNGPEDLERLVVELAGQLSALTGLSPDAEEGCSQAQACLSSGAPRRKWDEMLGAQGADLNACQQLLTQDHLAPVILEVRADRSGYIANCDARAVGELVRDLGAGRQTKDSVIQHSVGLDALVQPGDSVRPGDLLARIHAITEPNAEIARLRLQSAVTMADQPVDAPPLVAGVVES